MQAVKNPLDDVINILPVRLRNLLNNATKDISHRIGEISLRSNRPLCAYIDGEQFSLSYRGVLIRQNTADDLVVVTHEEVSDTFNNICNYSVYSHLNEIKEGYITMSGGHRAGISGTAVVSGGEMVNIRDISTVSLRVARQIKGCGDTLAEDISSANGGFLICGAPISGKTTVLRDIARLLSTKHNRRVSVVDSRGELSATSRGKPQLDIGLCDVLSLYPRALGIEQSVRCLSPEFIICDEIGSEEDAKAIISGINSGVSFIASVHVGTVEELVKKKNIRNLLELGAFERVAFLKGRSSPGEIEKICGIGEILSA